MTKSTPTTHCLPASTVHAPVPEDEQLANAQLANLAKAIGHPTRVAILRLLAHREGCIVGDIVDELAFAQSTVSQHLKQLREAGLIQGEIDGPRICYCINPDVLAQFKALVAGL